MMQKKWYSIKLIEQREGILNLIENLRQGPADISRPIAAGPILTDTMEYTRKHPRKSYEDTLGIPITLIQFGKLHRHDITVRGVDISEGGLGIVADEPLSPGFVWFWRSVAERKGGILVWSRKEQNGNQYRAGIQFLPIPISPDDYLQEAGK